MTFLLKKQKLNGFKTKKGSGDFMNLKAFEQKLTDNNICFFENESMKNHTTFKIGGNAEIFVTVKNTEEMTQVIKFAKEFSVPYFILGAGSNILVSDGGIKGAVIKMCSDEITVSDCEINCSSSVKLSKVCNVALNNGLTGLEFAYGIPASVGGAVYMNAGAYGGEMSQVVASAECVGSDGNIKTVPVCDMKLGYRTSVFKNSSLVITKVTFKLKKGEKEEINSKMNDLLQRRKQKQPLEYPSAGSTFKRPQGYFAGALIEKNNLKGLTLGGAKVSEKHAGFVINTGNATANDVKNLIKKIQDTVYENDGVKLETEVIFVGEEKNI